MRLQDNYPLGNPEIVMALESVRSNGARVRASRSLGASWSEWKNRDIIVGELARNALAG
jgi:hypothetical protein